MKHGACCARRTIFFLSALVLIAGPVWLFSAHAQDSPTGSGGTDEDRLVERIKEEILKELRDGDLMRQQIRIGIEQYVQEQRKARATADANKARQAAQKAKNVRPVSSARDHIYGNPDAEISLIEYSDFECPFCKRFHPTAKKLVDGSDGKINWVYRHFPLSFHNPGAQKQSEASECAADLGGSQAFWKYTDQIYARTRSNGKGFPISGLVPLAEELGLDARAFEECLNSNRTAARVQEDFNDGRAAGVTGTPGNILRNNRTGQVGVKNGAVPLAALKAEAGRLLGKH